MLNLPQKILLFSLYALIILMVIFSFGASKNVGKQGFDECVQKKCDQKGKDFCNKFREINNCCMGAGGKMSSNGCSFN